MQSTEAEAVSSEPHIPDGKNLYTRTPLYVRIIIGLILGVILGSIILAVTPVDSAGKLVPTDQRVIWIKVTMKTLEVVAAMLLRLLGLIAPPLILVAVIRAVLTAEIKGGMAGRLIRLLALNTFVAVLIGLSVANFIQPGKHAHLGKPEDIPKERDFLQMAIDQVPRDIFTPFINIKLPKQDWEVVVNPIGVIMIALAVGIAGRFLIASHRAMMTTVFDILFEMVIRILYWVIQIVPLAVLAKVAQTIGEKGYRPFLALAWFIGAVILALALQSLYYLIRVKFGSWVNPINLIRGTRDASVMAFSTASSTATMPVTYECLKERVGLRERSASLGALVGSNFNNDGTALYEAMAALFIAQMLNMELSITQQVLVVLTSVIAGCGAAGIPEAGLVTMTLVFNSVGLPLAYITLLLPVDWFLDRCRTMVNVMGDMNVSCLLDGKTPKTAEENSEG